MHKKILTSGHNTTTLIISDDERKKGEFLGTLLGASGASFCKYRF